ncbi:MAG: translation elongation factor Ts [Actinomycetia bacterium]|nr:translation elongation factor Ts [Actinomycetes bacterium]
MAEITAQLVKELREITGAGMMDCKKALMEAEGEIEAAIDNLRTHGLAAQVKKSGRATNEGAIAIARADDDRTIAMLELNCETDFVATNATFTGFAQQLAELVLTQDPADVEALKALPVSGADITVEQLFADMFNKLGENMGVARFTRKTIEGTGAFASYIHGGAKIAVIVAFSFDTAETAYSEDFKVYGKDIAMQVAAADPIALDRDSFDPATIAHELEIYKAQAAESGKPEAIQEKMAEGRLNKFYKEQALVEQAFVKDMDISISDYTRRVNKEIGDTITITSFLRYNLGETGGAGEAAAS